jgi:hypothetical protein
MQRIALPSGGRRQHQTAISAGTGRMFKKLRIVVLSFVLLNVAVGGWLTKARSTSWETPLKVVIYAINGDGSPVSQAYIDEMKAKDNENIEAYFADIENFFAREAKRYGLALSNPIDVVFAGEIKALPPRPPAGGSGLSIALWSLKLRYWASRHNDYPYPQDIEMYVLFFDPELSPTLAHSLGLQKGLIGVVNAFAKKTMKQQNHVIIAHELLHTVGASDKYDPRTNQPLYPSGYADPKQRPRYPQRRAEIMAGRMATGATTYNEAQGLKEVVIGAATAGEIKWRETSE